MLKIFFVVMFFTLCEGKPGLALLRRDLCPEEGGDKYSGCGYWKKLGYCDPEKGYGKFMTANCPATCGLCEARPTGPPIVSAVTVDINECLQAHNSKRKLHGAESLTWDTELARKAQAWALDLATRDVMEHAPWSGAGENLYNHYSTSEKPATCKEAVEDWYGEVKDYSFENPPNSIFDTEAPIGHFTQVVWKSTKKLGVGIATIKRGFWTTTYIVARYTPPGNLEGKFKQEVGNSIMA